MCATSGGSARTREWKPLATSILEAAQSEIPYPPRMIRGLLLDLDGTVYVGSSLLPGAAEAIQYIKDRGTPFLFSTNTTRLSRQGLHDRLVGLGIEVAPEQIHTGLMAAGAWLRSASHRTVFPLLVESALEDLSDFELIRSSDGRPADAVLVGDLGGEWSYALLNEAFRHLMEGAVLVAINRNRYWRTEDGLSLDAGPFVSALEFAAGVPATVVGKPARSFYESAAASLGVPPTEAAMVGDDIAGDVFGAQEAGLKGVLVRTGKFRDEDLAGTIRPDFVLDSIAELSKLLA
jgi:phospholysine phosphohistidine inorganic pyrophosphate phosphatase